MQTVTLYKYKRADGGTTVSPIRPDCDFDVVVRLIADEGMILTDDVTYTHCVDLEDVTGWSEIEDNGVLNREEAVL